MGGCKEGGKREKVTAILIPIRPCLPDLSRYLSLKLKASSLAWYDSQVFREPLLAVSLSLAVQMLVRNTLSSLKLMLPLSYLLQPSSSL